MNFPPRSTNDAATEREAFSVNRTFSGLGGPKQPSGDWEIFLGLWERANLVRAFFWTQRPDDEKLLLTHFLPRLRRFFAVDFCFAALSVSADNLIEVGTPEAGMSQLPQDFPSRCLESLANARAPVTWNEAGAGLGFRSTVVVPLRAPTGPAFGFVMLGHARARNYSAIELFLLQALAGEVSWVLRDLAARKADQQKLVATSHSMKNALQVVLGNASLIRQKLTDQPNGDTEKYLQGIEIAAQQILEGLRVLPEGMPRQRAATPSGATIADAARHVTQTASSFAALQERAIDLEVVYVPEPPGEETVVPDAVKGILNTLVDQAALATRNETVRLALRRAAENLEMAVRGMGSNRVADTLKMKFETATRLEDSREGTAIVRVREYLDDAGGDVYLKNRPGESAEFVLRLPLKSAPGAVRENQNQSDVSSEIIDDDLN